MSNPMQQSELAHAFIEAEEPLTGVNEINTLLYSNDEVEVKRYQEEPEKTVRYIKVTKVISPHLFLTEFDFPRPLNGFKDWRDAMQAFYNDKETREHFKVHTSILMKYRCYAYYDRDTGLWERVRVMKYDIKNNLAEVFLFEHTEFRLVSKREIMELSPEFTTWTAMAFPTHLLNIQPAKGIRHWSKEAVEYFKSLVEGKVFYGITLTRSSVQFPEGFPEYIEYLGMALIQKNPLGNKTLQAELVDASFADPTGFLAGYPEILATGGGCIGRFDLSDFEKQSIASFSLKLYNDRAVPSSKLVRTKLEHYMEKAEALRKNSRTGNTVEINQEFTPDMLSKHGNAKNENPKLLPEIFKQGVCQIRFSHMTSPSVLYVQLENNINELRELETALSLLVKDEVPVPFEEGLTGLPIACSIQVDNFREPTFVRAVIRQILPGVKLLKVVLVDYGSEMSIRHVNSRHLPKYFQSIPSFAFRVHLDSTMLVPAGGRQWTSDASDTFRKYMSAWNQQVPIYYVWRPTSAANVSLQDFNQELQWDPLTHKWERNDLIISPVNSAINQMADHPLLKNAYVSVGIDVVYEVMGEEETEYGFESLGDVLADSGFAMRLLTMKTLWGQHNSIVNATLNLGYIRAQKAIASQSSEETREKLRLHLQRLSLKSV